MSGSNVGLFRGFAILGAATLAGMNFSGLQARPDLLRKGRVERSPDPSFGLLIRLREAGL